MPLQHLFIVTNFDRRQSDDLIPPHLHRTQVARDLGEAVRTPGTMPAVSGPRNLPLDVRAPAATNDYPQRVTLGFRFNFWRVVQRVSILKPAAESPISWLDHTFNLEGLAVVQMRRGLLDAPDESQPTLTDYLSVVHLSAQVPIEELESHVTAGMEATTSLLQAEDGTRYLKPLSRRVSAYQSKEKVSEQGIIAHLHEAMPTDFQAAWDLYAHSRNRPSLGRVELCDADLPRMSGGGSGPPETSPAAAETTDADDLFGIIPFFYFARLTAWRIRRRHAALKVGRSRTDLDTGLSEVLRLREALLNAKRFLDTPNISNDIHCQKIGGYLRSVFLRNYDRNHEDLNNALEKYFNDVAVLQRERSSRYTRIALQGAFFIALPFSIIGPIIILDNNNRIVTDTFVVLSDPDFLFIVLVAFVIPVFALVFGAIIDRYRDNFRSAITGSRILVVTPLNAVAWLLRFCRRSSK